MTFDDQKPDCGKPIKIREVWFDNLESEIGLISGLVDRYPFLSIDTEFPAVIRKHVQFSAHHRSGRRSPAEHYSTLKSHVNAQNLIQLGLTLADAAGNLPDLGSGERYIWQFNFSDFIRSRDPHATKSIDLLDVLGIDFEKYRVCGIESARFAELMMGSSVVCNEVVSWVTFHSAYDFGHLAKILSNRELPDELGDFLAVVGAFFGNKIYDVKYLMRFCKGLDDDGLYKVAQDLDVDRVVGKCGLFLPVEAGHPMADFHSSMMNYVMNVNQFFKKKTKISSKVFETADAYWGHKQGLHYQGCNCHKTGSDSLLTWHAFQKIRDVYFVKQGHQKHAGVLFGLGMVEIE